MIEIENLSFYYGKRMIINGISVKLRRGRIYSVIGTNGCGKTTLMKSICALNRPCGGSVLLDGKNVFDYKRREFAKKLAFLPQDRPVPACSVYDAVAYARFPYMGISRTLSAADRDAVNAAFSDTETTLMKDICIRDLSGGERQRVYLAMLLAQQTPYVVLDEPTTYLDISHRFSVMNIIERMKASGKCVVAVLHDLELALRFSDEILVLDKGCLAAFDTPKRIVESGCLERVFGVICKHAETVHGDGFLFFRKND